MALHNSRRGQGWPHAALLFALLCAHALPADAAPAGASASAAGTRDATETKSDVPVEQLEKLRDVGNHALSDLQSGTGDLHRPEAASHSESSAPEQPENPAPAVTPPPDEATTKVFHGAARLVPAAPAPAHTAARRSFNADLSAESQHNRDHFAAYTGVQYSPLDMAEYVFWTGDERAVTAAVENLLQEGLMTKEEAIAFLQEIKLYLEYLRAQYAGAGESDAPRDATRALLFDTPGKLLESSEWPPLGMSGEMARFVAARHWQLSNALTPFPAPVPLPARPRKRDYDPLLQTNLLGLGADPLAPAPAPGEGPQARLADALAAQRALEELVYYLAKMMFASREVDGVGGAGALARRLLGALERQAQRGQLAHPVRQRLLDIIVAALTDTIGDHSETLQARDSYQIPAYRLMHDFLETNTGGAQAFLGRPYGN